MKKMWEQNNYGFIKIGANVQTNEPQELERWYYFKKNGESFTIKGYKTEFAQRLINLYFGEIISIEQSFEVSEFIREKQEADPYIFLDYFPTIIRDDCWKMAIIKLANLISTKSDYVFTNQTLYYVLQTTCHINVEPFNRIQFADAIRKIQNLRNKFYSHRDFKFKERVDRSEVREVILALKNQFIQIVEELKMFPENYDRQLHVEQYNGHKFFSYYKLACR